MRLISSQTIPIATNLRPKPRSSMGYLEKGIATLLVHLSKKHDESVDMDSLEDQAVARGEEISHRLSNEATPHEQALLAAANRSVIENHGPIPHGCPRERFLEISQGIAPLYDSLTTQSSSSPSDLAVIFVGLMNYTQGDFQLQTVPDVVTMNQTVATWAIERLQLTLEQDELASLARLVRQEAQSMRVELTHRLDVP